MTVDFGILKVGESLEAECSQLATFSPVLLIQGQLGGEVTSVKVASETRLLEAGSTVVEGFDRLFKTYWLCDMAYPEHCSNVFRFFEFYVYKLKDGKKVPPTIVELCSLLTS